MGIVPAIDELEVNALGKYWWHVSFVYDGRNPCGRIMSMTVQCHIHCIRIGRGDDQSKAFREIRILYPNAAVTIVKAVTRAMSLLYTNKPRWQVVKAITRAVSLVRCMIMQYHGARWLQPNPNMWCVNKINATQADGTCFVPTLQLWRQTYTQIEWYNMFQSRVVFSRVSNKAVEYERQSQAFYVRKDHQPKTSCWSCVANFSGAGFMDRTAGILLH